MTNTYEDMVPLWKPGSWILRGRGRLLSYSGAYRHPKEAQVTHMKTKSWRLLHKETLS